MLDNKNCHSFGFSPIVHHSFSHKLRCHSTNDKSRMQTHTRDFPTSLSQRSYILSHFNRHDKPSPVNFLIHRKNLRPHCTIQNLHFRKFPPVYNNKSLSRYLLCNQHTPRSSVFRYRQNFKELSIYKPAGNRYNSKRPVFSKVFHGFARKNIMW